MNVPKAQSCSSAARTVGQCDRSRPLGDRQTHWMTCMTDMPASYQTAQCLQADSMHRALVGHPRLEGSQVQRSWLHQSSLDTNDGQPTPQHTHKRGPHPARSTRRRIHSPGVTIHAVAKNPSENFSTPNKRNIPVHNQAVCLQGQAGSDNT
jgi:hypothetical protein